MAQAPILTPRRDAARRATAWGSRWTAAVTTGVLFQQISTCPSCHGRGTIIDKPCADCQGRGEVEREEVLTVTTPIGVEEGIALRIPGHGLPSRDTGGPLAVCGWWCAARPIPVSSAAVPTSGALLWSRSLTSSSAHGWRYQRSMATPQLVCRQGRNPIPCYGSPIKVSPSSGARSGATSVSVCVYRFLSSSQRRSTPCMNPCARTKKSSF
jgi:hypothetical protein